MIARLPPVGQPVLPVGDRSRATRTSGGPVGPVSDRTFELPNQPANVRSIDRTYGLSGFTAVWLNSGTAALAAALIAALACRPGRRDVLLPAYACPDLIAAALFAGARPVLVDCGADDPAFDPDALERACSERVAAVVAVNFLGIAERLPDLAARAARCGALLIEDCAQWWPEAPPAAPVAARVVSFGRGKPVNLLGGGALLLAEGSELAQAVRAPEHTMPALGTLKRRVFAALLHPLPYGVLSRVPGLGLGETRYHALDAIMAMDRVRRELAPTNVGAWLARPRWREARIAELLDGCTGVELLPRRLAARAGRLLRYPLLFDDRTRRDAALRGLRDLGASAFYDVALPQVSGVDAVLTSFPPVPGAARFAQRLLTLPLHDRVSERHLRQMAEVVCSSCFAAVSAKFAN